MNIKCTRCYTFESVEDRDTFLDLLNRSKQGDTAAIAELNNLLGDNINVTETYILSRLKIYVEEAI